METFGLWFEQLQQHRFFQQNLLNAGAGSLSKQVAVHYCSVQHNVYLEMGGGMFSVLRSSNS
jgi:hypothetical protein